MRIALLLPLLPLFVGAALLSNRVSPSGTEARGPRVGEVAPRIEGAAWRNHIGRAPALADLRGHPVLVEFWATW